MILYRIEKRVHAHKLDGVGASKAGARWNSKGTCMIYCGEHEATTVLEVLAHVGEIPDDRVLITYELPDDVSILKPNAKDLPPTWRDLPYHTVVQQYGDQFINDKKALLLRIPTALATTEWNYLMNPDHPEIIKVKVSISPVNYPFDPRLFDKGKKPTP